MVVATMGLGFAEETDQDKVMCAKWRQNHQKQVVRLVRAYLKDKPKAIQRLAIMEILRLEGHLASCSTNENDFYLFEINNHNLEQIPGQILTIYLKKQNVELYSQCYFETKTVYYFKTQE